MVRFSDMLGGSGDAESPRATKVPGAVPYVAPGADDEPDEAPDDAPDLATTGSEPTTGGYQPAPTDESPQDVLDRLTQYATSARAADQVPPPAAESAPAPEIDPPAAASAAPTEPTAAEADLSPVGDDLLPRAKESGRRARRRR